MSGTRLGSFWEKRNSTNAVLNEWMNEKREASLEQQVNGLTEDSIALGQHAVWWTRT